MTTPETKSKFNDRCAAIEYLQKRDWHVVETNLNADGFLNETILRHNALGNQMRKIYRGADTYFHIHRATA